MSPGIMFRIGFALGVAFILTLFLFSRSMCAGHLHRSMMEMMPGERHPTPETGDSPLALGPPGQLFFVAAGDRATALEIHSTALGSGGTIPEKYTCNGSDISPPLSWTEPPAGTKSLALI